MSASPKKRWFPGSAALSPPVPAPFPGSRGWSWEALAGRFVELSGGPATAALSTAFRLVLEAQERGEPAAWITGRSSSFFPPDAARTGVDLGALAVVRAPETAGPRAADLLLRSGGFGLVVLDLGRLPRLPLSVENRLAGLARRHGAAFVALTEKGRDRPSLGSLVSLRADASRIPEPRGELLDCEVCALKDKRAGAGWRHREVLRAPDGVC